MQVTAKNEILTAIQKLHFDPRDDYDLSVVFAVCRFLLDKTTIKRLANVETYLATNEWRSEIVELNACFDLSSKYNSTDAMQTFVSICKTMVTNDLILAEKFYSLLSPYIVADWPAFIRLLNGKKKLKAGQMRMILTAFLSLRKAQGYVETSGNANEYASYCNAFPLLQEQYHMNEEEFTDCWEIIFYYRLKKTSVPIDGDTQTVIRKYETNGYTKHHILADYAKIMDYRNRIDKAISPYAYITKGILKQTPVESGVGIEEVQFNLAASKLKDKLQTDIIRSLFYTEDRNDSALENTLVFNTFHSIIQRDGILNTRALVVNPSPDFVLCCEARSNANIYAVPDETVASLYKKQFKKRFITFSEIGQQNDIEASIIFARDYELEKIDELLQVVHSCVDTAQILALLPNVLFSAKNRELKAFSLISKYMTLDNILVLPTDATASTPKKKVLCHFTKNMNQASTITFYKSVICGGSQLSVRGKKQEVSYSDFFQTSYTVNALMKRAADTEKKTNIPTVTRKPTLTYAFSNEIGIAYSLQEERKGRAAAKAYYCAKLRGKQSRRLRGERLTEYIEKGLRAKTKEGVLVSLENVPFNPKVEKIIVDDMLAFYKSDFRNVSIKTLWFCCRKELEKSGKYDEGIAKTMFCDKNQELSQVLTTASAEEYMEKMSKLFQTESMTVKLRLSYQR